MLYLLSFILDQFHLVTNLFYLAVVKCINQEQTVSGSSARSFFLKCDFRLVVCRDGDNYSTVLKG